MKELRTVAQATRASIVANASVMILKKGLASVRMREVDGRQSSNVRRFLQPFRLEEKRPNGGPCRSFPQAAIH
jgi:hypothetical protein